MAFLVWLESIRNPVLDAVMSFFTLFGEEIVFMLLALTVFWCVNKKEGYYLLFLGFFGTVLNQFLKILCRIPRPWVQNPQLTVVGDSKVTATGYSFPSGHTQNVTGTLGGIARWHQKTWLRVACVVTLLLTAFSRMYLGVHTPLDVGVSLAIGAVLVFVFYPLIQKICRKPNGMYLLLGVMVLVAVAFALYANLNTFPADVDPDNLYSAKKNSFSLLGALLGFCAGYPIEQKYIRFPEKAKFWQQLIKIAGGLAGLMAIKEGLKLLFNAVGLTHVSLNAPRYFAMVFFAAAIWPLIFTKLFRFGKGETT